MRSGTYLYSYCPHCEASLNDDNHLIFSIINIEGETGTLKLSPFLNTFTNESTVALPENMSVRDILCPKCEKSLVLDDKRCPECDSRLAGIKINAMHHMLDFFICSKRGCHWHGLEEDDIKKIELEDSEDW